ncbi:multicopper oxidase domain-containing protein [Pseudomonas sp. UL073]|uniref:Multicopper oxidase CueO n=1 Tax=Zestomonas insulae TaxID=2809017 RepID=A0ABS2IHZ5_9GAMM|nr:multicopper oxidase domain-containing protein [Pseudomonas insulae]MBM7062293.1 multicopper oxidase domain-containing protein [Pseudomonas insulae]
MKLRKPTTPKAPAIQPGDRRTFLKLGGAALAAPWLLRSRPSQAAELPPLNLPPSPATTPWLDELPRAWTNRLEALDGASLDPYPQKDRNTARNEAGRDSHQRYDELCIDPLYYELRAREGNWQFHQQYPFDQKIWGFSGRKADGSFSAPSIPGPLITQRYGRSCICRIYNDLPATPTDPTNSPAQALRNFGSPEISTHLHNLHAPSESDGFPGDFYSATKSGPTLLGAGQFKDHFYPNVYAGYDQYPATKGDPREALGTLWYHDHCLDFTASNTYKGLFGFYLLHDELDSGDETTGLCLPSGDYDYPLAFIDRRFDADRRLVFDQFNPEGTLGDKVVINGKIEPLLKVTARKYRFRLLNAGPSRFYAFSLLDGRTNKLVTFDYIANDGNLLPKTLRNKTVVILGVAERGDIVVDFSKFPVGTELYLINRMRQEDTRNPKDVQESGPKVLKFKVDRPIPTGVAKDKSKVPDNLRPLPPLPTAAELAALPVRRWEFTRSGGLWAINEKIVNVAQSRADIPIGSGEIWELANLEDGWEHPVHIHFEEGRIISRKTKGVSTPIPDYEGGRKDVYVLHEFEDVRVFLRFRDFKGRYVMHCHNLIHEDHAMMLRFDIT